jgi:Tol biopolymer transport system component
MWILDKRLARLAVLSLLIAVAVSCGKGGSSVKPPAQDTTPPVITGGPTVRSLTDSSATITWVTDDLSNSVVQYSKDSSFGSAVGDSAMVINHLIALAGLSAVTTYHYRVMSSNAVNLPTRSVGKTFTTASAGGGNPAPSNARVVFTSARTGKNGIYVMNIDGSNQQRLTDSLQDVSEPAWSWDRNKIAYVAYTQSDVGDQLRTVMVMAADGSGSIPLTFDGRQNDCPAWSPDGTKIVFSKLGTGTNGWDLYVLDTVNGTKYWALTNDTGDELKPSWSPDGTKIAYAGMRDGFPEVFVVNSDGSGARTAVTQDSNMVNTPRWSPDGTKIAYVRWYMGYLSDVTIINADGTNPVRVTHGGIAQEVCWDPDGKHLVYTANGGIFRIAVDGTNSQLLTSFGVEPDSR